MARHRNVRSMNYSDEYDGYDDVYGHSVEDDYCVSPSEAAFMYNREGSRNQQMGAFIKDIAEEDEQNSKLSESEMAELETCIAQLRLVLGNSTSKEEMTKVLIDNSLNVDKSLNILLDTQPKQDDKKEKDDNSHFKPSKQFKIPKLNSFKIKSNPVIKTMNKTENTFSNFDGKRNSPKTFSSLSDLSSSHLKNVKSPFSIPRLDNKINSLSKNISNIKLSVEEHEIICEGISNSDSTDNVQNYMVNDGNQLGIDLTKALTKNTLPKINTEPNKKYNYLNVSNEKKVINDFNCTMDISFVLNKPSNLTKGVSTFGKILCCKYKKFVPVVVRDTKQHCGFSFNILSPDDIVKSHLKT